MLRLPPQKRDGRTTPPLLVVVTGFGLAALLGSRMPLPGNLAQGLLDALGCWALMFLIYTSWAHGTKGLSTLGHLTISAFQVVMFPLLVAVLIVLASRVVLGLP